MNKLMLFIVWSSMLVPIVSGIILNKRLNLVLKGFVFFIVFSLFFDIYNAYIGYLNNDNQWVFKLFLVFEFIFFAWFYHKIFEKPIWHFAVNIIFIALFIFTEILSNYFTAINNYASWFHLLFFLFFIVQSAYAIVLAFKTYENNIFNSSVFWISFGRLFYFVMISFVFIYPKFIYLGWVDIKISYMSVALNVFANIILYMFFTSSLLCLKNQK